MPEPLRCHHCALRPDKGDTRPNPAVLASPNAGGHAPRNGPDSPTAEDPFLTQVER